jgi:hypothetical protein
VHHGTRIKGIMDFIESRSALRSDQRYKHESNAVEM